MVSLFQGPTGVSGPKGARGAQGAPVSIFCFHYNPVCVLNVQNVQPVHIIQPQLSRQNYLIIDIFYSKYFDLSFCENYISY